MAEHQIVTETSKATQKLVPHSMARNGTFMQVNPFQIKLTWSA
jgi:hypothetical protein